MLFLRLTQDAASYLGQNWLFMYHTLKLAFRRKENPSISQNKYATTIKTLLPFLFLEQNIEYSTVKLKLIISID
jgi:hypothetical protein